MSAPATGLQPARATRRWARRAALAGLYSGALLLGAGSALLVLKSPFNGWTDAPITSELNGPWRASHLAGSPDADAYTRARVALGGLLALSRSETLYYIARHDSAGQALKARCRYRVSGLPPPARWWSITAYADDLFLFAQDQRRYSLNSASAAMDAQGRFELVTGPLPPGTGSADQAAGRRGDSGGSSGTGDTAGSRDTAAASDSGPVSGRTVTPAATTAWLPTPGAHGLVLALRLYQPDPRLAEDPHRLQAPSIVADGACR